MVRGIDQADWLEEEEKKKKKNSPLPSPLFSSYSSTPQGIHFTEAARNALPGGRPQRPSESSKGKGGGALLPGGRRLLTLSTSLHSCAEVEAEAEAKARDESPPDDPSCCSFDYVFLSPLFESISKPGYGGGDGKAGGSGVSAQFWRSGGEGEEGSSSSPSPSPALAAALRSARESPRRRSLGVVALGGVEASRLRLVAGLGFEAAAVLGAVWGREDPVEAWAEVLKEAAAAASASASASASSSAAAAAAPS